VSEAVRQETSTSSCINVPDPAPICGGQCLYSRRKIICQKQAIIKLLAARGGRSDWRRRGDTMQRLFWLLLLTVFPACAQTSLVFTWGPNPSNTVYWPPCSKSVKKMCRTGYTLTDVTGTSAPVVITSTIAQDAFTYTLIPLPSPGLHTYGLVVNAKASAGKPVHSDQATVKVAVPYMFSNPPAGFKATATLSSILFTWVGSQNKDLPVCSTKVRAACLTAYTLRDLTNASEPVSISSSIGNVLSYTLNRLPKSGTHTYDLVVSGIDQNGTSRSSTPAIASVLVSGTP
jgi:hypothetical protein